ncbi:MAG TPA: sigma-70 family RNA polymerase sigma factor [Polyangiaceae bacterium]
MSTLEPCVHVARVGETAIATDSDRKGSDPPAPAPLRLSREQSERISIAITACFPGLFRAARRLGLPENLAEEAIQEAMLIFAQRIAQVAAGSERAFLFGCVARIAANLRKSAHARHEVACDPTTLDAVSDDSTVLQLLEQKQARETLDRILGSFSTELREVFVLYEIEQLTMSEIAVALGTKLGTVSSRLHRARQAFDQALQRFSKSETREEQP